STTPPSSSPRCTLFFFFNHTPPTEISTLSLHDALPIYRRSSGTGRSLRGGDGSLHRRLILWLRSVHQSGLLIGRCDHGRSRCRLDRKSTRLNSSHRTISYAVFCLKKKKQKVNTNNI